MLFTPRDDCPSAARTLPILQRSKTNLDDVDSSCQDHIFDASHFMLQADRTPHIITSRRQVW